MNRFAVVVALFAFAAFVSPVSAADVDLEKAKCPVSGQPVSEEASVDYKDAKVYFCCNNCKGKFEKDSKPFEKKANAQLVATKQYVQKGCPISGQALNEETKTEVDGVEVCFCCFNCKGKVDQAEKDEKLKIVFAPAAFAKAFKLAR